MPEAISAVGFAVGYAMLNAAARYRSAVSPEAGFLQRSAYEVVETAKTSIALFGGKAQAISGIWQLANDCSVADWDGEGAKPISEAAAAMATDFVSALPDDLPLPEFAPENDGAISLDWIGSRYRVFTLSINGSNRLAYAWLDGADRGHGVVRFNGVEISPRVLDAIRDVSRDEHALVRAA